MKSKYKKSDYHKKYHLKHKKLLNNRSIKYYYSNKEYIIKRAMNWNKKHPRRHRKTILRRIKMLRKARLELIKRLGNKCNKCKFKDIRALQIDKIKGGHQKMKKHYSETYAKLLKQNIVKVKKDWQVLCANCNWIKRYINKEHNIVKL